jgi:predicted DNA-binding transcriptional regulator AlpA
MGQRQQFGFMPRGLSREEAAYYVGIGLTLFDKMVADGRMPQPIRINSRVLWDVRELDSAFGQLRDAEDHAAIGALANNPFRDLAV